LQGNPGFPDRFPVRLDLEPYDANALSRMFTKLAAQAEYAVDAGAADALLRRLNLMMDPHSGNPRSPPELLSPVKSHQNARLKALGHVPSRAEVMTFIADDFVEPGQEHARNGTEQLKDLVGLASVREKLEEIEAELARANSLDGDLTPIMLKNRFFTFV